jgi:penicillin G amidase
MHKLPKIFAGIILTLIVLFLIGGFILYNILKSSLPEYEGTITSAAITNEIEIFRDSLGIPYILAQNEEDASFALGYVHAQDRLFTMDLTRRAAEGRLSEVLGSATLPFDKMFRTVGIRNTAEMLIKKIDPKGLALITAYSAGVNQYILDAKGKYPVEFDVLGYDPEEWTPIHSIAVVRMMAWELNISWWVDFAVTQILQKVGEEKAREILPNYPENAPTVIPPELKKYPRLTSDLIKTSRAFRSFFGMTGTHLGSNNWVVNGNLSASGKPIIANDTHLAFSAPSRWYTAVIKGGGWNAAGATLPGVPGVVLGKNDHISWAITNIMADDADFYIESLDSTAKSYLFNGKWEKLKLRKEIIKVKDSIDVEFEVKSTHRGPIVSETHPYTILYPDNKAVTPVVSMRWMGHDFSDEFLAFYKINTARNWDEFKAAFPSLALPGQNFAYSDIQGNIGYVFGGRLPLRGSTSPTMIFDGTTEKYDWKGYVPQKELPVLFNPPAQFIASANNKILKTFPYYITNMWEPPSRYIRIVELLSSRSSHSVQDYFNYQMDVVSPYAAEVTPHLLAAFEGVQVTDTNLSQSLYLLEKWDFSMNQYSQIPSIYQVFYSKLLENIYKDELGHDLFNEFLFVANVPFRSILDILNKPQNSWWNNINTPEQETKEIILRQSLSDALSYLENRFGKDLKAWQWGKMHKVVFKHPFGGVSSIVDKFVNIGPYELGGDGTTIFNTEYSFNEGIEAFPRFNHEPYENDLGPVVRFVFDWAEPDKFYFILSTGQSGNIMSPHYKDMVELWLNGKYAEIRTDLTSIRAPGNKLLKIILQK